MLATAAETRAAEEEKARTTAAKTHFNVAAPPNTTTEGNASAAAQQASGNNSQRAVTFNVPANSPPVPGRKPTIRQGLNTDLINGKDLKTKVFVIFKEAQGGDEKSKKELSKILTSTIQGEINGMVLAMKKSAKPGLGHSAFEYLSRYLRSEDNYHGSTLVYVNDRDDQGQDPRTYEMDEETVKEMGGTKTVEGVKDQDIIKDFYKEEANKGKLYIPPKDATLQERKVAAVLPASKKVQKFVLEKNPSMYELYEFAETLDDNIEKQTAQEWAIHACQAKPGDNSRRPTSILAHDFEPVEMPSEELRKALGSRLDLTIGPGQAAPVVTTPAMTPEQLATNPAVMAERHAQDANMELVRMMKKTFENQKPKKQWTSMQKNRLCGWSNKSTFEQCSKALKRLENYIGDDDEAAQYIKEEMEKTAEENGLRLHGVDISKKLAKMLTSAQPSHDNSGRASGKSAHKYVNHTHFLSWTPDEREERVVSEQAQKESASTRTQAEAKENAAAGARRTPADYVDISSSTEAYYCFLLTFFPDAKITNDYRMMHDLMQVMREDKDLLSKQTIMTLSWHMLNNDAQYWSVRTNANDLYEGNNLPRSTLQLIMPGLKINKELRTPVGIPKEWRAAPVFKKREREQEHHRRESEGGSDAEDDEQGWMTPHKETHPKIKEMMREYYDQFDGIRAHNRWVFRLRKER